MTVQTLPTSAEVISATQTNADQKTDFASMLDFLLAQLGAKSGQGPQTVASAATLNLDAVTDTRDIVISGVVAITAVTIEAGKVFRCRASGAFTLTNNANIVTNTGANIVCAAGDSFVLRATATNTVEVVAYTQSANIKGGTNAPGAAPMYSCRAWVNFNGTGVVAINASGNVSSITDNGVGDYTVNFTAAMPDVYYSLQGTLGASGIGQNDRLIRGYQSSGTGYLAGSARVECFSVSSGARVDHDQICIAVFR